MEHHSVGWHLQLSVPLKFNPRISAVLRLPQQTAKSGQLQRSTSQDSLNRETHWQRAGQTPLALTYALDEARAAAADAWWRWCPTPGCCGCSWANPQGATTGMGYFGSHGRTLSLRWETRLSSPSPQQQEIGLRVHFDVRVSWLCLSQGHKN